VAVLGDREAEAGRQWRGGSDMGREAASGRWWSGAGRRRSGTGSRWPGEQRGGGGGGVCK
jgi:hypothetical protein